MSTLRTITLTGRPPVRINDDDWDVIAKAVEDWHDGQVRCQANRLSEWSIRVRQNEDGRAIVYATYNYTSNFQGAAARWHKAGVLVEAGTGSDGDPAPDTTAIIAAIQEVARTMADGEHHAEDGSIWGRLADECIADLAAVDI